MLIKKSFRIKSGLHTKPSASFVKVAERYESNIVVEHDGDEVDGKSFFGVLALSIKPGSKIKIKADGRDAKKAINELGKLIKYTFSEE
jgi:phosphocarrier protein HPr